MSEQQAKPWRPKLPETILEWIILVGMLSGAVGVVLGWASPRQERALLIASVGLVVVGVIGLLSAVRIKAATGMYLGAWWKYREGIKSDLRDFPQELPVGAPGKRIVVADYLKGGGLYIDQPYRCDQRPDAGQSLHEFVEAQIRNGERVLVTAEPGFGKSLLAERLYLRFATTNAENRVADSWPALIYLNNLELDAESGEIIDHGRTRPKLVAETFAKVTANPHVVLLADGLDEIPSSSRLASSSEGTAASVSRLLDRVDLLTGRAAFYDLFFSSDPAAHGFTRHVTLLKLDFDSHVVPYIKAYCDRIGRQSEAPRVLAAFDSSRELKELSARPLILCMATDVIATEGAGSSDRRWTEARVYDRFTRQWLKTEASKKSSTLRWDEKDDVAQQVAWAVFCASLNHAKPYGRIELQDLTISEETLRRAVADSRLPGRSKKDREVIVSDTLDHNFLVRSHDTRHLTFVHKTFYEYYVARHVVTSLTSDREVDVADLLKSVFPDPVIGFIRNLLRATMSTEGQRSAVERKLMSAVHPPDAGHSSASEPHELMARQQAANLVPTVASDAPLAELRALMDDGDEHPFIRRGIAVGLALHRGDDGPLRRLVQEMSAGGDALRFHLAYNKIYYGDLAAPDEGPWWLAVTSECRGLLSASLRQLGDQAAYGGIWSMSLFTIDYLLASTDEDTGGNWGDAEAADFAEWRSSNSEWLDDDSWLRELAERVSAHGDRGLDRGDDR